MECKKTPLKDGQYFKEVCKKEMIVLHHTVSSNMQSPIDYWNSTKERVATAFIIGKNGDIAETFNPEFWAYHLGKGTNDLHNKKSIGIELVNEGGLIKKGEKFYWLEGKVEYKGTVCYLPNKFRGYDYFAQYPFEQVMSLVKLLKDLCNRFGINKQVVTSLDYNKNLLDYKGIIAHCNVRPDKSDVSPAINLAYIQKQLVQI